MEGGRPPSQADVAISSSLLCTYVRVKATRVLGRARTLSLDQD